MEPLPPAACRRFGIRVPRAMLIAMALQAAAVAADPVGDDIVVTARQAKCRMLDRGRPIKDAEFRAMARLWAQGRPVTIVVSPAARTKCLAKIMFRLADYGVTRANFVNRPDEPE